jgi:3-oxoacyl-[acyl-carrier-protein] synthase III
MKNKSIGIIGLGHCLPEYILTNARLEQMVETSDEWIVTRTGIRERRVAGATETTSSLAIGAAREALANSGILARDVELIIVATISPDSHFPSVACLVQRAIGSSKAAAFDVSAACSGFLYALTTAKQFLLSGLYRNALVIAAEKITSLVDWNDRSTCVLFGDGAGAAVLTEVSDGRGIVSEYLLSLGDFSDLMKVSVSSREIFDQTNALLPQPKIEMQGQELFKIAVNSMAEAVLIAAEKAGVSLEEISCVVPHQANDRIISAVAKKLGISKEKIFINIEKYGNMSAASVAVALYEAVTFGRIRPGDTVVLVAFGAGLVAAANIVKW